MKKGNIGGNQKSTKWEREEYRASSAVVRAIILANAQPKGKGKVWGIKGLARVERVVYVSIVV